ncbi:MAG TPA: substrate-binding domain-containing protein [Mycobacteriales bacterium]|nr:substrate-binding domain-containing protein [Mycobacteriales bacterium]
MNQITRRRFLAGTGVVLGGAGLAACGSSGGGSSKNSLSWWDQFQPLAAMENAIFKAFERKHPKLKVEYTTYDPNKQGQAIQLAHQGNQMPDVFSLAGIQYPPSRLAHDGWFSPLQVDKSVLARLPENSVLDGMCVFDGKTYSFPTFSPRQYSTLTWFNSEVFDQAGLDPDRDLSTWDDFRRSARQIKSKISGGYGWIAPIQFPDRMATHVDELAAAGGGTGAIDPRTGEYAYSSDPYVNAIEFLLSMKSDDSLFPASASVDARTARVRWAAGKIGLFFDGPWNVGVVKQSFAEFLPKVGVTSIPTAEAGDPVMYSGPPAGVFWISASSKHQQEASELLAQMTTDTYYEHLADSMDQPPIKLDAVARSHAHPTYKKSIELFAQEVLLAPSPIVRNTAVSDVQAAMEQIKPDVGDIVQGAFSGQISDVRKALQTYNDKITQEREKAVKQVSAEGKKVSLDDWKFANWDPKHDYTSYMYPS